MVVLDDVQTWTGLYHAHMLSCSAIERPSPGRCLGFDRAMSQQQDLYGHALSNRHASDFLTTALRLPCRGASPSHQLVDKKKKLLVDALLQHGIQADQSAKARLYQYCESFCSIHVQMFAGFALLGLKHH